MKIEDEIYMYMQLNLPEDIMMLIFEADNYLLLNKTLLAKKKLELAKRKIKNRKIKV